MNGKLIIRYADGRPYPIVKRKRPRICGKCGAFATWGIQTVFPVISMNLDAELEHFQTVKTFYFCAYHIKTA